MSPYFGDKQDFNHCLKHQLTIEDFASFFSFFFSKYPNQGTARTFICGIYPSIGSFPQGQLYHLLLDRLKL